MSLQAQLGPDVNAAVVADVGDYNYTGQQYDPVSPDAFLDVPLDAAGTAVNTVRDGAEFLERMSSFGAYTRFDEGRGFVGGQAGVRTGFPRLPFPRGPFALANRGGWQRGFQLGPLYVGDFYAGAGFLYSEYQGRAFPRRPAGIDSDSTAAVLWTSFRVTAFLSDNFALSVRPYLYYLPFENRVGYAASTGIGLGLAGSFVPNSLVEVGYTVPMGRWDLSFYDRFDAFYATTSALNSHLFYNATLVDAHYDAAGRYGFGGFGAPIADATGNATFDLGDRLFDGDRTFFRNIANASMNGWIADDISASFFYQRSDIWNDSFDHRSGWNTAGALFTQRHPFLSKYAGYRVSVRDGSDAVLHWAYVGANMALGPNLTLNARGGYLWVTNRSSRETAIGRIELQHRLGPYTYHGISTGRTVTDPDFGTRYLADYVRYYLAHSFGYRSELRFFAQYNEAERLDAAINSGYSSTVAGLLFTVGLTPTDTLILMNSYEAYEWNTAAREYEIWTHRLTYLKTLSLDCSAQFYYQYQHANATLAFGDDFSEHLLYFGIIKRF